jgi:hypothetical protein
MYLPVELSYTKIVFKKSSTVPVLLWLRDTSPIHNTHVLLLKNLSTYMI